LQDVRVRQAIAMGLDRNRMIETLVGTERKAAASYWDNSPYVNPEIKPWPYDPDRARQLLDEAGWVDTNGNGTRDKDGTELVLTQGTITSEVRTAVQNEAKRQLVEIGVTLDLYSYDAGTFLMGYYEGGPAANGTLDIFEYAARTKNYPDPGTNDFLCAHIPSNFPEGDDTGENWSWLCDQTLDPLLQAQATQIDFQQRQATFHQISKIIYDNVYFMGLWTDPDIWAASQRLKNVQLSGITPLSNIAEWDVAQ
jgi:peptide/nickel transport system substrate-binding protein